MFSKVAIVYLVLVAFTICNASESSTVLTLGVKASASEMEVVAKVLQTAGNIAHIPIVLVDLPQSRSQLWATQDIIINGLIDMETWGYENPYMIKVLVPVYYKVIGTVSLPYHNSKMLAYEQSLANVSVYQDLFESRIEVSSAKQAVAMVSNQYVDSALVSLLDYKTLCLPTNNYRVVIIGTKDMYVYIHPKYSNLAEQLNSALDKMDKSGLLSSTQRAVEQFILYRCFVK